MLLTMAFMAVNIIWAVLNWKTELKHLKNVWSHPKSHTMYEYIMAVIGFGGDLVITAMATSIFGFTGFYGAAMAIFMSNILSIVFFMPKKKKSNKVVYA